MDVPEVALDAVDMKRRRNDILESGFWEVVGAREGRKWSESGRAESQRRVSPDATHVI